MKKRFLDVLIILIATFLMRGITLLQPAIEGNFGIQVAGFLVLVAILFGIKQFCVNSKEP